MSGLPITNYWLREASGFQECDFLGRDSIARIQAKDKIRGISTQDWRSLHMLQLCGLAACQLCVISHNELGMHRCNFESGSGRIFHGGTTSMHGNLFMGAIYTWNI